MNRGACLILSMARASELSFQTHALDMLILDVNPGAPGVSHTYEHRKRPN